MSEAGRKYFKYLSDKLDKMTDEEFIEMLNRANERETNYEKLLERVNK